MQTKIVNFHYLTSYLYIHGNIWKPKIVQISNNFRCNFTGPYPIGLKKTVQEIFNYNFRHPSNIIPEKKEVFWNTPNDINYKGNFKILSYFLLKKRFRPTQNSSYSYKKTLSSYTAYAYFKW